MLGVGVPVRDMFSPTGLPYITVSPILFFFTG
jgi:hypothetical protein